MLPISPAVSRASQTALFRAKANEGDAGSRDALRLHRPNEILAAVVLCIRCCESRGTDSIVLGQRETKRYMAHRCVALVYADLKHRCGGAMYMPYCDSRFTDSMFSGKGKRMRYMVRDALRLHRPNPNPAAAVLCIRRCDLRCINSILTGHREIKIHCPKMRSASILRTQTPAAAI